MGLYSLLLIAVPALFVTSMVCAIAAMLVLRRRPGWPRARGSFLWGGVAALVLFHAVWDALQDRALAPTTAAAIVVLFIGTATLFLHGYSAIRRGASGTPLPDGRPGNWS